MNENELENYLNDKFLEEKLTAAGLDNVGRVVALVEGFNRLLGDHLD